MAVEGESPIWGCVMIAGGGFAAAVAVALVIFGPLAHVGGWVWYMLLACFVTAAFWWLGWVEVQESVRYHRRMRAHRAVMFQNGARL